MSRKTKTSMTAMAACHGVLLAATAMAQSPPSATTQDGMSVHHQRLYKMMKDMPQEMTGMTEQMSRVDVTPESTQTNGPEDGGNVGHDASHVGL